MTPATTPNDVVEFPVFGEIKGSPYPERNG